MYKICVRCKMQKLFIEFAQDKQQKSKLHSYCKACVRLYWKNNKIKLNEQRKLYRLQHPKPKKIINRQKIKIINGTKK